MISWLCHISPYFKNRFRSLLLVSLSIVFWTQGYTQNATTEKIKGLQRSIVIFNLAQQVNWPNMGTTQSFKIGVLGADPVVSNLRAMAEKRKIQGKSVEVLRFDYVKDVKNIQLLYVNKKFNFDMHYILSKIATKNILLVSEDYNFNTSMVNIINVGNSFEYEVNLRRIEKEGFTTLPTLRSNAITSSEKWKQLYQKTEKILEKVKEDKTISEHKIEDQKRKIFDQELAIDAKEEEILGYDNKINTLYTINEIQQKKYEEKVEIEKALENSIQEQIELLKDQDKKISESNLEIKTRDLILKNQSIKILEQKEVLAQKTSEINAQKKINILLGILVFFILLTSILIYKGFLNKKKLSKELEKKNQAIQEQSLALESKNKELEHFAYIASHDLQEPLNTISSFIGLISENYGETFDDLGRESMKFITDASARMRKLINALLEYSRLGREKEYSRTNCNTVIKELIEDLNNVIKKTGATINVNPLPIVNGSEIELRLLFQNLISNGIKFRDIDTIPEIQVSCAKNYIEGSTTQGFWEFSVQDNGIGIPQKHQDRIFAIFQRLHSREEYEGTGIGLAHCKKIVESHGGTIWLESEEGKGTTFYFTIPI
ncbi:YfiR/HmsC family protein [Aquimarina pacifica]|uniref:YfiR/HmsC family protein n=1 Tax=Aquimarina pacifica TaxID=1296415 RepID=UPI0009E028F3|nr:YfiR/HmsC family protein [Aquimarina pacifica]